MDRRTFVGAAAVSLASLAAARAQPPAIASPQTNLHDLMPAFWRAYDGARARPTPQRVQAIDQFRQAHAPIDAAAKLGPVDTAKWLGGFDPAAPAVLQVSQLFPAAWAAHSRRFARALPDAVTGTPAYALVSFGQFSSRPSVVDGQPALVFGVDTIAQQQGADFDLGVLFDHDAFLLYQQQVNPALAQQAQGALWGRLWREGLAQYASARLNPGASRYDVLLDNGLLMDAPPSLVASVAAEALNGLDARDALEEQRLFDMGAQGELPPRMGFLIALMVAERIGKGRTLAALARTPATQARALMQSQLSTLAHG